MNITFDMIETDNLGYQINNKQLLGDISVQFKTDEISLIVGPNGAGKSTLIKLLSQQLTPSMGSVTIEGTNISTVPKAELARSRAVLSQGIELAFPLTVKEVIMMGRYPHFSNQPSAEDQAICQKAMAFFEVENFADRNYLTLSGGEKQRVHFARIAAQIWPDDSTHSTKYLMLDEPLAHLDIYYQYEFMAKLKQLMQLQPMVVIGVLHDLNLAYRFADHVLLLHKGNSLAAGSPDHVFTKEYIQQAFLMEPSFLENQAGKKFLGF